MSAHGACRDSRSCQRLDRSVTGNVVIFVLAAFFEIAGCFAFWISLRRGATPLVAGLGVISLIALFALTRVDSAFAGRAYAAYGGIYIATSLVWLWLIGGTRAHAHRPGRGRPGDLGSLDHHRLRRAGALSVTGWVTLRGGSVLNAHAGRASVGRVVRGSEMVAKHSRFTPLLESASW